MRSQSQSSVKSLIKFHSRIAQEQKLTNVKEATGHVGRGISDIIQLKVKKITHISYGIPPKNICQFISPS